MHWRWSQARDRAGNFQVPYRPEVTCLVNNDSIVGFISELLRHRSMGVIRRLTTGTLGEFVYDSEALLMYKLQSRLSTKPTITSIVFEKLCA